MAENGAMLPPPPRIALRNSLPFICLIFFFAVSSIQASKRDAPDSIQEILQQQMSWDESQPGRNNPDRLHLQFFKIDETASSGKSFLRYRVYVPGIQEDRKYTLTVWKIGSDPHILSRNIYANAKGLLMMHKPGPGEDNSDFVDDELHLGVEAARGEPVRYTLASTDNQLSISGTLIPFPLEDTDRGCRLEVRLGLPDAEAVLIFADGLAPNAVVPFQMVSAGESESGEFHADAHGHAVTSDFPYVAGMDEGSLRVTLATPNCSAAVEVPWGKGSYHPL